MEQGFKRFGSYAINAANIVYVENKQGVQFDVYLAGREEPLRFGKGHPAFASFEHWWRNVSPSGYAPLSDE